MRLRLLLLVSYKAVRGRMDTVPSPVDKTRTCRTQYCNNNVLSYGGYSTDTIESLLATYSRGCTAL